MHILLSGIISQDYVSAYIATNPVYAILDFLHYQCSILTDIFFYQYSILCADYLAILLTDSSSVKLAS